MTPVIPFFVVGFMSALTIALARAMAKYPDPDEQLPRPLNAVLVGGMGWSALAMTGANSLVHFGLFVPALAGISLYAIYRILARTNLIPLYRFGLGLGLVTVISTVLVASQHFTVRSIS